MLITVFKCSSQPNECMSTEKLGVDAVTVQHGVEGLMYLLTECSKILVRLNLYDMYF